MVVNLVEWKVSTTVDLKAELKVDGMVGEKVVHLVVLMVDLKDVKMVVL